MQLIWKINRLQPHRLRTFALDRTQPGLPIKPGKWRNHDADYKRHGTTTPFAALNTLEGVVHGRCMQRHTQGSA